MKDKLQTFVLHSENKILNDLGLLATRLLFGFAMVFQHGLGNLMGFSEYADKYPDPIGLGSKTSMVLMIFAEFFCAIAVSLGFLTKLALIPLIFGLSIAFFVYHAGQTFEQKELAYLYLSAFVVLMFLGAGRFSLDAFLFKKNNKETSINE